MTMTFSTLWVTWRKVNRLAGFNMASDITSTAADLVQCPVCFNDFQPASINGHLDACLLGHVTDAGPTADDPRGPPVKKPRISAEVAPPSPAVNKPASAPSSMAGTQPSAVFSLFQANKSKASAPGERGDPFTSKHAAAAAHRGVKRGLQDEADPGPAAAETHASVSRGQSVKLLTTNKPLAETLRPSTLEEYFGQNKVVGHQTLIRSLLDSQEIPSLILWGPPGCGKVL